MAGLEIIELDLEACLFMQTESLNDLALDDPENADWYMAHEAQCDAVRRHLHMSRYTYPRTRQIVSIG